MGKICSKFFFSTIAFLFLLSYCRLSVGHGGINGDLQILKSFDRDFKKGFHIVNMCGQGDYIYIAYKEFQEEGRLLTLNVKDLKNPIIKHEATWQTDRFQYAVDMVLIKNFLYIAYGSLGLLVFDLSIPLSPNLICQYGGVHADRIRVSDHIAYLLDFQSKKLNILNIKNPRKPNLLARLSTKAETWGSGPHLLIRDRFAYIVSGNELEIINIKNPSLPRLVSRTKKEGWSDLQFVEAYQDKIYLAGEGYLYTLDIRDRQNPVVVGKFTRPKFKLFPNPLFYNLQSISLDEKYLYFTAVGGLYLFDILTNNGPKLVGFYEIGNYLEMKRFNHDMILINVLSSDKTAFSIGRLTQHGDMTDPSIKKFPNLIGFLE